MTTSVVRHAVVVLAGLTLVVAPAAPARALSDGEMPGRGLGMVNTLLLFVGVPLAICGLIALLVVAGAFRRGPRYRPGRGWDHDPVWFAGPADPNAALVAARPGTEVTGGGASAEW